MATPRKSRANKARRAPSKPVFAGALSDDPDDFDPVVDSPASPEADPDEPAAPVGDAYDAVFAAGYAAGPEDDEDDGGIEVVDPVAEGIAGVALVDGDGDALIGDDAEMPAGTVPPEWESQPAEESKFDPYYNPKVPGEVFRVRGTRAMARFQAGRFVPRSSDEEQSVRKALRGWGPGKEDRWKGDDMKRARQCGKCGFTTRNSAAWADHVNGRPHG